uniref:Uncharacterized protein n=1 Tax=Arion vulgaris TaxID=1028688 RepID=A0A0B6ZPY1_9EUPU
MLTNNTPTTANDIHINKSDNIRLWRHIQSIQIKKILKDNILVCGRKTRQNNNT